MSGWLKKEAKGVEKEEERIKRFIKKEEKEIKKEEEKVVFTIHRFKVRKKLFFSVLMGILVAAIGFTKVDSLLEVGKHISSTILAVTFIVCLVFLFLTVIRKNIKFFAKQISILFIALFVVFWIATLKSAYNVNDLLFVTSIVTTVASSIYDVL